MHRLAIAICLVALLGLSAGAQFRTTRFDPETDPKAFEITTRADLEDTMRRVASLREQLKEARTERDRTSITETILGLCQDELSRQSNASGAIVVERSTDPRTPGMATRWHGVFQALEDTLRELGPEALQHYERIYGPRAEKLLQDAQAARDVAGMESLNRRFGLTRAGLRATTLLAAMWWEEGDINRAARALERALFAPELLLPAQRASLCAWLSHCYRDLGERASLSRLFELPAEVRDQTVDEGGAKASLNEVLKRNLLQARDTSQDTLSELGVDWPGGNYTNTGLHERPTDFAQIAWSRNVPRLAAQQQARFMGYPAPIIPPYMPLFDGDLIYLNNGDRLLAYDLVGGGTGEDPLWSCKPFPNFDHNWRTSEPDPAMILPVSAWHGTVFAALENPLSTQFHDRNPDPMFGLYSHYPQVRRGLCAVDATTGRLLWKLGGLYEGNTDDTTSFVYAVVYDGVLYAVGSRVPGISEIFLYALQPQTGEILWNLRLCYGQQETTMFGRPARTPFPSIAAIAGGEMYLCTNLGGVVAVSLNRRCLNWISRYEYKPRPITKYTETYYRDVSWANNPTFYTELDGKAYVVVAPADSEQMFGLDARTGEILWRIDRMALLNGGRALVGLRGGTAYVAGDGGFGGDAASRLMGVDIRAGRVTKTIRVTPGDRGNTLALQGRPCMAANRLYWPGSTGRDCAVAEIDLDADRVVGSAYAASSYAGWGYSVFAQHGILFTVSGNNYSLGNSQLAVRFNQTALLDAARKAATADTANTDAMLRYGLLTMRLGDRAEALKYLRLAFEGASRPPVNPRVREHASRALVAAYLKLADDALASRKFTEALGHVQNARAFALLRSQRTDCFVRQEKALVAQQDFAGLRQLLEDLVAADPAFGVGEDPEIPARTYGMIRLAGMIEAADAPRAAALWQQVQESPDRLAWQGKKLRTLGVERLKAMIQVAGRGIYKPQDEAADALLATNTPESLMTLLRQFPLALAADEAALRLAEAALGRGEGVETVKLLLAVLEDNSARPHRAGIQAWLALAHAKAGEKLRARLVASRTLREFPAGTLRQAGKEVPFRDLLTPLLGKRAGAGAEAAPRLPAAPVELWSRPWDLGGFTRVPQHFGSGTMQRVYLGERAQSGFQIVCQDAPSGDQVWSRASDISLNAVRDTEHGVLFETAQGFSLFDDSGSERWSLATGGTPNPVCLEGDMLVYGTRFTNTSTRKLMVRVSAVDLSLGGSLWQVEFEASVLRWLGQGDAGVLALLSGNEQQLCLLNPENGAVAKTVTLDLTGQVNVQPVVADGLVWVVDVFGQVRGFDSGDLALKYSFSTGQRGAALLRVQDGKVCCAGGEGAAGIEIKTGKVVWSRGLERGELLRGVQQAADVFFISTRDATGGARVLGLKVTDGTVAFRYTVARANEADRMELQNSAAFDGGVALAYSVHSMVQGNMQLSEFKLILLNADGTERMAWSRPSDGALASIAQVATIDGHVVLACASRTFCFGKKP